MAIYAFPSITSKSNFLGLIANTKTFRSPLTGAMQVAARQGNRWHLMARFPNLKGDDRQELIGFLMKLNGQEHYFTAGLDGHSLRGAGGGTPKVAGASQTGDSIDTDGWPNSTTVLKRGDLFSFSNGTWDELKMATDDVTSNGSGEATIDFQPSIRTSPSDNADIEISSPIGTFILLPQENGWESRPGVFSDLLFDAVEVIV